MSLSTCFTVYVLIGGFIALVLAAWEFANRLDGYSDLPLRSYVSMMILITLAWPWTSYMLIQSYAAFRRHKRSEEKHYTEEPELTFA